MDGAFRAIELGGTIDDQKRLQLDEPLPVSAAGRVRVIVLIPEDDDVEEREWLRAAVSNPVFDPLREPEEDVYTPEDGRPFDSKG